MDKVNLERMQHMLGGPVSEHIERSFNRLENQASMANAETHPSGWILAMCAEISYLSGRIAELESDDDPDVEHFAPVVPGEYINVEIKDTMFRAKFLGLTETGRLRVRLEGEERVRVVLPGKVYKDD